MPTAKPLFNRKAAFEPARQFSDKLRRRLREYYPPQPEDDSRWSEDPVDQFVQRVLFEAEWFTEQLHAQSVRLKKQEIRAVREALLSMLDKLDRALRSLSEDLDRILPYNADRLDTSPQKYGIRPSATADNSSSKDRGFMRLAARSFPARITRFP